MNSTSSSFIEPGRLETELEFVVKCHQKLL